MTAQKKITLLGVVVYFFSCSSEKKMLDSYIGVPKDRLVKNWGQPLRTTKDTANGEVLIYKVHTSYAGTPSGGVNAHGSSFPSGKEHFNTYRSMYIHSDGTIYSWTVKDTSGFLLSRYSKK
jgi:hypothetical protein